MATSSTWPSLLALILMLGSTLVSGIFFAFSTFIMKALGRVTSEEGMVSMQSINVVVVNPWVFSVFLGTAILSLATMVITLRAENLFGAPWLLLGAALYFFGCFLVTGLLHVPMNESLAEVGPQTAHWEELWRAYQERWTAWNHVRTGASFLAAVAFGVFLLKVPAALPTSGG